MFSAAFTDTIYIAQQTGVNPESGHPEYGEKVPVKARVQQEVEEVTTPDGNVRTSSYVIYTGEKISRDTLIYVEEEKDGQRPLVVEFSKGIANPAKLCKVTI